MRHTALIGGGGHALSLLDILPPSVKVAGYVDLSPTPDMDGAVSYLGNDEDFIIGHTPSDCDIFITLVSGPECSLAARRRVIDRYAAYGSPVIVSSSAIASQSATIEKGTAVFHHAVINAATTLGAHCVVNTGAIVEHGCSIGSNVFIGPGAVICGGVTIGDDTYIGAGAIVKPGIKIGTHCIIGAGAVVAHHLPNGGTYVGIPAHKIR